MRIMGRDSIAIVPAAPVRHRNNDVEYAYRQDSDFHYLTGFPEPESVAILIPCRAAAEYVLFVRDRDPLRETWDGKRAGPDGATRDHGADDAFPIGDIDEILPGLLENRAKVYYGMGLYPEFDQRVIGWLNGLRTQARNGRHPPQELIALDHVLHDMRLYKGRAEFESAEDVPHQMYSEANASMEAIGSFDHADSEGFLRVLQVSARALAANGQVVAPAWARR